MPKEIFTIQDFKGGLNSFSGQKEIAFNEFSVARGVSFSKPGEVATAGAAVASDLTAGTTGFYSPVPGEGVFALSSDYKLLSSNNTFLDDITGSSDYLDAGNYHILLYLSEDGAANAVLNILQWVGDDMASALYYTSTNLSIATGFSTGTYVPMFYVVDGGIRIGVQNFDSSTTTLQGRKLLTIISRKLWACATDAFPHIRGWQYSDATPVAPIRGTNIHFVPGDADGNTYDATFASEGQGYNDDPLDVVGYNDGLTIRMKYYDVYTLDGDDTVHTNAGTWSGKVRFYVSFIYDGNKNLGTGQESPLTEITTDFFGVPEDDSRSYIMDVQVRFSDNDSAYNVFDKRITGINIYYAQWTVTSGYGERYLLTEIDCHRALIKKASDENWQLMETDGGDIDAGGNTSSYANYEDFLLRDTYLGMPFYLSAGYGREDAINAQFKHTAVLNRRVYAANVITSEKAHGDRMMKSLVNKFDIFTDSNYVDVDINDGDEITHLEGFADRILQFKKRALYIINVSPTAPDFIEAKYDYMGVQRGCQVAKTEDGVVWANKYGLFMYGGDKPINLTDNRIDKTAWEDHITDKSVVGYDPIGKQIITLSNAFDESAYSSTTYTLDLKTMTFSWNTLQLAAASSIISNFVNLGSEGKLTWLYHTGTNGADTKFYEYDYTPQDVIMYRLATKEFDFDKPGIKKRVYNVKITYKCHTGTGASSLGVDPNVTIFGVADGETVTLGTLAQPPDAEEGDGFQLQTFDCGAEFKNLYNFQVVFSEEFGETVPKELVITDITCVYRVKTVK